MNILITGGDSFVSRSIYPHLSTKYNVDILTHKQLDLTKINQLINILNKKTYDFIINTAISGQGRLLKEDSSENFYNNLLILENLIFLKNKYGYLITFGSGAENNRQKDILDIKEGEILEPPINKYNLAKYISSRRIFGLNNIINIRIFNCFGVGERSDRFISTTIRKYINKETIEIWKNVYHDFFYNNDLFTLIDYYIQNPPNIFEEINAVYPGKKYLLSDICAIINYLDSHKVEIKINGDINRNHTGNGDKLAKLNLSLLGLRRGIEDTYRELLKNNGKQL